MADFKLLVDTNVVIALEDPQPVEASLAELFRLCNEYSVGLFVDGANYDDVGRDRDDHRRQVTLSKLDKFQKLRGIPMPDDAALVSRFGAIRSENDRSDVRLLATLDSKAVDFLVSADIRLHKRAERASIDSSVLTVEEALTWLKQSFATKSVALPHIIERKAYELSQNDAMFASLRLDYPLFDQWFDKCKREHRDCWVLEIDGEVAGLVIRKDEKHADAQTTHRGPKILKICTFKVREEFQGEKFGELLLKRILWYAQQNSYDLTYITAFPKHAFLIELLRYYGFHETETLENGERVLEKPLLKGPLPPLSQTAFDFDRTHYPRFHDGPSINKFCIPIQAGYHRRLFPEIAFGRELPLSDALACPREAAELLSIEVRKQVETFEFREPYRSGGVQSFGEKRAFRRIISRLCRLGVQSPNEKSLLPLASTANELTRRIRCFGQTPTSDLISEGNIGLIQALTAVRTPVMPPDRLRGIQARAQLNESLPNELFLASAAPSVHSFHG
jgi:GNAT superfamily N-acetyltransferase